MVFSASSNFKILSRDYTHDIARAVETVFSKAELISVFFAIIAANRIGPAREEVTALPWLDRVILFIHHADFISRADRVSLSIHAYIGFIAQTSVIHQAFRHAEDLLDAHT